MSSPKRSWRWRYLPLEVLIRLITFQSFNGLRLVVSVSISAPVPDLSSILAFLRVHRGFIRFVELSLERAPKEILECVNQTQYASNNRQKLTLARHPSIPVEMLKRAKITHGNVYAPELDVHDLLESIQSFSAGTISIEGVPTHLAILTS